MRTAIYCRVSGARQKDNTSLPSQESCCREKATALGWDVSEAHVYREVMGGEDLYRPEMDRLWEAIMRHEIDGVVVDVLDRLSRDEGDQASFYNHCDRYGVAIELASQDIDDTEQGRILRTVLGIVARMERVDIRRHTQGGRRRRAAVDGKLFPQHYPLYGYLFTDDTHAAYMPDPETAWVVVRIFAAVADGAPIREVARRLAADGIPTPAQVLAKRGQLPNGWRDPSTSDWNPGSLGRILRHPAYWGEHSAYRWSRAPIKERPAETGITRKVFKQRERALDDPKRIPLPAATCPALISPDLAARAAARLAHNKAESAGHNPDPLATLFRGRAVCAHCGYRMGTSKRPGAINESQRRYRCSSAYAPGRKPCPGGRLTMDAHALDPAAWGDVVAWLSDGKNVARLLADWQRQRKQGQESMASRLAAADAQIAALQARMASAVEAITEVSSAAARAALTAGLDDLAAQLTREQAKREQLVREAADERAYAVGASEMREWARLVSQRADQFTPEQRRDTLRALGAQVTVWRADAVHADGWPQRYKVTLTFSGFGGQPVTLSPAIVSSTCCY